MLHMSYISYKKPNAYNVPSNYSSNKIPSIIRNIMHIVLACTRKITNIKCFVYSKRGYQISNYNPGNNLDIFFANLHSQLDIGQKSL